MTQHDINFTICSIVGGIALFTIARKIHAYPLMVFAGIMILVPLVNIFNIFTK